MVEEWDRAAPEWSARRRSFTLPPLESGAQPHVALITVTRETAGTARFPAMYSLGVEVLDWGLGTLAAEGIDSVLSDGDG